MVIKEKFCFYDKQMCKEYIHVLIDENTNTPRVEKFIKLSNREDFLEINIGKNPEDTNENNHIENNLKNEIRNLRISRLNQNLAARIAMRKKGAYIRNLDKEAKIYVNGKKLKFKSHTNLKKRSIIRFGNLKFQYYVNELSIRERENIPTCRVRQFGAINTNEIIDIDSD